MNPEDKIILYGKDSNACDFMIEYLTESADLRISGLPYISFKGADFFRFVHLIEFLTEQDLFTFDLEDLNELDLRFLIYRVEHVKGEKEENH